MISAGGRDRTPVAATCALLAATTILCLTGCGQHSAPAAAPAPAHPPVQAQAPSQAPAQAPTQAPTAPSPAARPYRGVSVDGLPESAPERIDIPRLRMHAPLMAVDESSDGSIDTPPYSKPGMAGWYDGSVTPGQVGTATIVGHVDTHRGPAVFYLLSTVRRGDTIDVRRADNSTAQFTVDAVRVIPRSHFDNSIYGNASVPELHLITCGGHYNRKAKEYSSNVVVFAHLVSAEPMPVIPPQDLAPQTSASAAPAVQARAVHAPAVQAAAVRPKG